MSDEAHKITGQPLSPKIPDQKPDNPFKYDTDSVRVDLLPTYPLFCIATGFGFGAVKYVENSWRNPDAKPVDLMRTYGSVLRHLMKWQAGEEHDEDSGLPHLWLAGCQLLILIEHHGKGLSDDKRHIDPKMIEVFNQQILENTEYKKALAMWKMAKKPEIEK